MTDSFRLKGMNSNIHCGTLATRPQHHYVPFVALYGLREEL